MKPLQGELVGLVRSLAAEHGDFVRFPLGTKTYYLLNRPAAVRRAFAENAHRLRKPAFLRNSNRGHWGDGITTLEGAEWRSRRALVRSAFFGADAIRRNQQIAAACTQEMLSSFRYGRSVNLQTELRILVARIAARSLFDAEVEGFGTPESHRRRAGVIRFEEAFGEDFTAVMEDEPIAPLALTRPRAPRRMDSTLAIIDARLRSREDRGDMLSFLMDATAADGVRLTREEIVGEIVQMFHAGHVTIPRSLADFWAALFRAPLAARRVHEEAARLPDGFASAAEGVPALFKAALRESMRLHAPAPILFREVAQPFAVGDHSLEVGAGVWVSPHLLHRDPRNFPEPERFWLERFDRDHMASITESAYLPFGAGPRTCIANRMAMAQMGIIIALTARHCQLIPRENGELFDVAAPLAPPSGR
ncbi:cytochrome P450 [Sorangium sp. So ce233]|uniref:cytochrome P450 n=1 Tax=Sorangium sp. So ce233 TaxID=3133290 RepID=UPI003F62A3D4